MDCGHYKRVIHCLRDSEGQVKMISIKLMLDDLLGKRVINGKHIVRQGEHQRVFYRPNRAYDKDVVGTSLRNHSFPYYSRNYNHGRSSSQQLHEKFSNARNEQFDRSRLIDIDNKAYERDYHHRSMVAQPSSTVGLKNQPVSENNNNNNSSSSSSSSNQFHRRSYFVPSSKLIHEESPSANANLILQSNQDRARSFVVQGTSSTDVLRPPLLSTTQSAAGQIAQSADDENSSPRIREIVTFRKPLFNTSLTANELDEEGNLENNNGCFKRSRGRGGKRTQTRRELAKMRKRIADLSLQSPTSKKTTSSAIAKPGAAIATTTTSTQTAALTSQPSSPSLKQVTEDIIDVYRCEKCRSLCLPELYECGAGHAVCDECWLCLSRCPGVHDSEHVAGGFRRAHGLEKLAKFFKFPCRWQDDGCKEKLGPDAWREHTASCQYFGGKNTQATRDEKLQPVLDSGLDSDDDVVVILEDDDYEFLSGEE